ncbi:amidase [Dietzia natronolimnaea]|uniref:amidase n=1 Tax=Dietzia natronolimnaea TaxID=161920 RepID=A0A2A2WLZ5_9ACTN|nr:amidase [Dietzia natronolimnaea]PAY22217.1 amidase [Dietzia natronolimnaea]
MTTSLTALELSQRFRSGALSPVDAAVDALEAIERVDGEINAFCHVDRAETLAAARRSEDRYRQGAPLSPLDGVPTSIKDIFYTRGVPTLRGSRLLARKDGAADPASWPDDAPVTSAVHEAGCVVIGKTTTPEFAWKGVTDNTLTGITRNPHDTDLTPGGSSGGASAAVAAGLGQLALGTDGGGSVRIPAAFCGIVALKPTYGVIPMFPSSPFGTLAHAGPMTRTVADTAAFMDALLRPDPRDWSAVPARATTPGPGGYLAAATEGAGNSAGDRPLEGLRVAYSRDLGFGTNDPEVEREVTRAVDVLASLGARVDSVDPGVADPVDAFHVLWFAGLAAVLAPHGPDAIDHVDPSMREALGRYHDYSAADYLDAVAVRMALGARMADFHQGYDILITPTTPIPAFAAGSDVPPAWHSPDWTSWTPYTYPFNMTQQPALSVPCGTTDAGLPVGIQIVGARFDDRLVVRVGAALEAALGQVVPAPRIHASPAGSAGG